MKTSFTPTPTGELTPGQESFHSNVSPPAVGPIRSNGLYQLLGFLDGCMALLTCKADKHNTTLTVRPDNPAAPLAADGGPTGG